MWPPRRGCLSTRRLRSNSATAVRSSTSPARTAACGLDWGAGGPSAKRPPPLGLVTGRRRRERAAWPRAGGFTSGPRPLSQGCQHLPRPSLCATSAACAAPRGGYGPRLPQQHPGLCSAKRPRPRLPNRQQRPQRGRARLGSGQHRLRCRPPKPQPKWRLRSSVASQPCGRAPGLPLEGQRGLRLLLPSAGRSWSPASSLSRGRAPSRRIGRPGQPGCRDGCQRPAEALQRPWLPLQRAPLPDLQRLPRSQ